MPAVPSTCAAALAWVGYPEPGSCTGIIAEAFRKTSSRYRNRIAVYGLSEQRHSHLCRARRGHRQARASAWAPCDCRRIPRLSRTSAIAPVSFRSSWPASVPAAAFCRWTAAPPFAKSSTSPMPTTPTSSSSPPMRARWEARRPSLCRAASRRSGVSRTAGRPGAQPGETDGLVLKVTSGSTGLSKVAVTPEQTLINDGRHVIEAMGIGSSDIGAATVPMAHSYGMGNLLLPLILEGAPVVMRDRFVHAQWAGDVTTLGVTMFPGVPFIFDYLRRAGDAATPLTGIRLVVTAGAPIDFETLEYFKQRFGVKIHSLYGTTETGSITFDGSDAVGDRVSVGWPMPETTVTLLPTADLESGGRILVRGSAVSRSYALRRNRQRVFAQLHGRRFSHRGPRQVGRRWAIDADGTAFRIRERRWPKGESRRSRARDWRAARCGPCLGHRHRAWRKRSGARRLRGPQDLGRCRPRRSARIAQRRCSPTRCRGALCLPTSCR